jgi:hypothetical protein
MPIGQQNHQGAAAIVLGGLDQLIDLVLCQVFAGARWVRAAASLFELQCLACDTERSERRRMTALAVKFSKTS